MSDERPIEEIIGWTTWGRTTPDVGWIERVGATTCVYHRRAEVDDLAAWLNVECEHDWDFGRDDDDGDGYYACAIWSADLGGRWSVLVRHAPTILAALEAAVRKVAAQ